MEVQITLKGERHLVSQLQKLETAAAKKARVGALTHGAVVVRADAAALAPRAERLSHPAVGHLADHIIIKTTVNKKNETVVSVGPDSDHWYGVFAERGTPHHEAQPWLRPALDENEDIVQERIISYLRAEIKRLTGA